MKSKNFCLEQLNKGGYFAEYQNYQGSGMRGALAGTGLHDSSGRVLLTDCRREFIYYRDAGIIEPVSWSEGGFSGVEWRLKDGNNNQ